MPLSTSSYTDRLSCGPFLKIFRTSMESCVHQRPGTGIQYLYNQSTGGVVLFGRYNVMCICRQPCRYFIAPSAAWSTNFISLQYGSLLFTSTPFTQMVMSFGCKAFRGKVIRHRLFKEPAMDETPDITSSSL